MRGWQVGWGNGFPRGQPLVESQDTYTPGGPSRDLAATSSSDFAATLGSTRPLAPCQCVLGHRTIGRLIGTLGRGKGEGPGASEHYKQNLSAELGSPCEDLSPCPTLCIHPPPTGADSQGSEPAPDTHPISQWPDWKRCPAQKSRPLSLRTHRMARWDGRDFVKRSRLPVRRLECPGCRARRSWDRLTGVREKECGPGYFPLTYSTERPPKTRPLV